MNSLRYTKKEPPQTHRQKHKLSQIHVDKHFADIVIPIVRKTLHHIHNSQNYNQEKKTIDHSLI